MKKIVIALATLASACAFIEPKPGAEKVVLFTPEQASRCAPLGSTKVSVLDRAGFIARDRASVRADLQALARNTAIEMGGDTIAEAGPVSEGQQTFNVYRCQ